VGAFVVWSWDRWVFDYLPAVRLVQFVTGNLCALAMKLGRRAPFSLPMCIALVIGYHAALLVWDLGVDPLALAGAYSGSHWWATPVFALLVMAAAQADIDRSPSPLRGPVSLRLGHWSYSWYLLHGIVIGLWLAAGVHLAWPAGIVVAWAALGGTSLLAAGALYTWVENPAERSLRSIGPGRVVRSTSDTMSA
jgi:peptidoglycan/LPS O-acetylase OafA/YrhL